jgi:hypothetical protein
LASDDFERRLHRLFAETPAMPDEALFSASVRHRLDQAQSVRRLVIGALGGLGAAIATAQVLATNVGGRLTQEGEESAQALNAGWRVLTQDATGVLAAVPLPGEVMWTAAALAALAVGFLATRMADPL